MSTEVQSQVGVHRAIEAAFAFVQGTIGTRESIRDARLEEVQRDLDGAWLVTVSFLREQQDDALEFDPFNSFQQALKAIGKAKFRREYKTVVVNPISGEVEGMRIRAPG